MYCNKCGNELEESSRFCKYCGNKLKDDTVEPVKTQMSLKEAWKKSTEKVEREQQEKEKGKSLERIEKMKQEVQRDLKPKDGKHNVTLIKSKSKSLGDNKINIWELEGKLEMIQNQGYEIVDIRVIGVQYGGGTVGEEMIVVYK